MSLKSRVRQTLKDFEERRVPIDVHAAVFHRTSRVIFFIWAQKDFYRTLSAGQMDRQTLEKKKDGIKKLTWLDLSRIKWDRTGWRL